MFLSTVYQVHYFICFNANMSIFKNIRLCQYIRIRLVWVCGWEGKNGAFVNSKSTKTFCFCFCFVWGVLFLFFFVLVCLFGFFHICCIRDGTPWHEKAVENQAQI